MSYTLLGTLAGETNSVAASGNGTYIVGWVNVSGIAYGAMWTQANLTAAPTLLGAVASQTSAQAAMISGSHIIGLSQATSAPYKASLWDATNPTAAPTLFGMPAGATYSSATSISGNIVVGFYIDASSIQHACMWDVTNPTATPTDFAALVPTQSWTANWISGTAVVGTSYDSLTNRRATLWNASSPGTTGTFLAATGDLYQMAYFTDGTYITGFDEQNVTFFDDGAMWTVASPGTAPTLLGTTFPSFSGSDPYAIGGTNIVGDIYGGGVTAACYWDLNNPTAGPQLLAGITGSTYSAAYGFSGSLPVGEIDTTGGVAHAVAWSAILPPPTIMSIQIGSNEHYYDAPFKTAADGQSLIKIEVTAPGIARATLKLYDPLNSIVINDNDSLVIYDEGIAANAFYGNVQTRDFEIVANYRWWNITAVDLNSWLDTIIVGAPDGTQFLEDPPGTFTPYDPNAVTQGSDSATVQSLFTNYAAFLGIDTTTFVETLQPNISAVPIRWNEVTLRSALNDVAALVSPDLRYWIDANKKLHWTIRTLNPLPSSGTANGPLLMLFPKSVTNNGTQLVLTDGSADGVTSFNYENMKIAYDDSGWADLIYVSGATTYTRTRTYTVKYLGGGLYQGWTGSDHVYGDVYPTPSSLTVRASDSDSSGSLGTLAVGTIVVTTGYIASGGSYSGGSDWYSIIYKNQVGWIHAHGTAPYNNAGLVTGTIFTCDGTLQSRTIPATTTPQWKQEWATGTPTTPTGVRFDPTQPDRLFVCQGQYPYIYCIKLSDRSVISKTYIGRSVPYPAGLSSDPNDSSIYWILNSAFEFGGTSSGAFFAKMRASDNTLLAKYNLSSTRWSDIRVSGNFIWLTNLDDDLFHKYSKITFTEDSTYSIVYNGTTMVNPTGTYVDTDGATTTLGYFFLAGNIILRADETAPTTITGSQSTAGTDLLGGDMNILTHAELFACDPLTNRTYGYSLQTSTPASTVNYYVIEQPGGTFDRYWMPSTSTRSQLVSTVYADSIGGSGWVDPLTNDVGVLVGGTPATTTVTSPRQRILTANNSDSQTTRDSIGGSALNASSQAVVRGSCTIYTTTGGWVPGQGLLVTSVPAGLSGAAFMTQKTTTSFKSGVGYRQIDLEWGNAPHGSIGLRRGAQIPAGTKARRPTLRMEVLTSNSSPGPNGTVKITAQAIDQSGNPWPIVGKTVVWSLTVYDTNGNEVTPVVTYAFNPTSSVTNVYGQAWTYLTVDSATGLSYYVKATATT